MLTYTTGCVTKHFNNFNVLLVGRLFCGVATSLLNSVFESWLVAEHRKVRPWAGLFWRVQQAFICLEPRRLAGHYWK